MGTALEKEFEIWITVRGDWDWKKDTAQFKYLELTSLLSLVLPGGDQRVGPIYYILNCEDVL